MKRSLGTVIVLVLLSGCDSIPKNKNKIDYSNIVNHSCREVQHSGSLVTDTLRPDAAKSSMEGHFLIHKDTICFADQMVVSFLLYDTTGSYLLSKLKKGRGPDELFGLHRAAVLPDGGYVMIDEQWYISRYDANWTKTKGFRINWSSEKSIKELVERPDPNDLGIYEIEYGKNRIVPYGSDYIIIPIVTEAKNLNGYEGSHARDFYEESYTLAMISLHSGTVERMLCNYSPVYRKYTYLSNFKYPLFDVDERELIYSFEADTLIYRINLQDSVITSFGIKGRGMDTRYPEYRTFKDSEEAFRQDRENYGYYRYIKYIPEEELLFRGYRKGKPLQPDGLQIYRNDCLIGDVEVPRDFEVIGYIAPWFYASGKTDYENEKMTIYRFKLN